MTGGERVRRYSDTVKVKTTKNPGGGSQVVLTEAGVAMAGAGGAESKTVT